MVYLIPLRYKLFETEGMWQSVQSWLVLSGQIFRLSALSTAEPPLPAILQLPLAIWPDFQADGLSGSVISAFSSALACIVLNAIMVHYRIEGKWRVPLLAFFALNPLILYYSGSGSSAAIWILITALAVYLFLSWMRTNDLQPVISLGFVLGLALLIRYDAAVFSLALLIVLCMVAFSKPNHNPERIFGLLFTCAIPIIFVFGIWLVFSLLISFGPYSLVPKEQPQAVAAASEIAGNVGFRLSFSERPSGIDGASWPLLGPFPFFAVGLFLLLFDSLRTQHKVSQALLALSLTFPILWLVKAVLGWGSPTIHDTVLTIPFGFIAMVHLLTRCDAISRKANELRLWAKGLLLLSFGLSTVMTGASVFEWAVPKVNDASANVGSASSTISEQWENERAIANYLRVFADEHQVLIDENEGYRIIFFTSRPELFLTWGADGFNSALQSPAGNVDYVLVRNPQMTKTPDIISSYYPALYELGAPWAELVVILTENQKKINSDWHLYKVMKPSDIYDEGMR
ncbi:MAG: hypothetical protein ACOX87_02795 [Chloroflexota bacterium]